MHDICVTRIRQKPGKNLKIAAFVKDLARRNIKIILMPVKIPAGLPAREVLGAERIFALEHEDAEKQQVRPLRLVILNLMPKKIETETQLLRLLSKSPLQLDIDFMRTGTHAGTHVSRDHLLKFYETFDKFSSNCYDGMIITGAPVEHLEFEQVDYWDELKKIMDWANSRVFSVVYLCWGAMAGLYHRYGVRKKPLKEKLFGVYPQHLQDEFCFLTNGFDEISLQPHSRHAGISEEDVKANERLRILTTGPQTGPGLISTSDFSEVFAIGHWEYEKYTLAHEYERDIAKGMKNVPFPHNYFPFDNPENEPVFSWRAHANLFWRNWLNWVYETTPYRLEEIPYLREKRLLGTDRSVFHEPENPRKDRYSIFLQTEGIEKTARNCRLPKESEK